MDKQIKLKNETDNFNEYHKPKIQMKKPNKKKKRYWLMKKQLDLLKEDKNDLDSFESKIFPTEKQMQEIEHLGMLATWAKVFDRLWLKILTSKQML